MRLFDSLKASVTIPQPYQGPQADDISTVGLGSPWATSELESVVWNELITDPALLPVTRSMIQTVPAFARGRDLIAGTLARLTLVAADTAGGEKVGSNSALFVNQPDPTFSRFQTVLWTADDLIHYGVSWWLITSRYSLDGRPKTISRVLPWRISFGSDGVKIGNDRIDPDDLIRIDGPNEGLITRAAGSVRNALTLEAAAAKFAQSPVPLIELHQTEGTIDPDKIKALIQSFANARSGPNGLIGYTPSNITLVTHGEAVPDLLTAGRNQQAIDAARFLGIPADALDASPAALSMTYANVSQRAQALVDFGIAPYASAIESRLSMPDVTPGGTVIRFAFDELTAPSDNNPNTPPPESTPA